MREPRETLANFALHFVRSSLDLGVFLIFFLFFNDIRGMRMFEAARVLYVANAMRNFSMILQPLL